MKLVSMKRAWAAWDEFWFAPKPLINIAAFRLVLCFTLFTMYLSRQPDVRLFFMNEGLLPESQARSIMPLFYQPPFEWHFWSDAWAPSLHLFLIFGLLLLGLGIGGRVLNALVWVVSIGFLQRNYSVAFGADLIGNIFLFLMIGMNSCERLSLLNVLKPEGFKHRVLSSDLLTGVFYCMVQIQLCVIYMYTGFEKFRGASWWDGTALWTVMANSQMVVADMTWLRNVPLVVVGLAFATILFEIYFGVLIWIRKFRPVLMIVGACFHLGIGLIMALFSFSFVMLAPYFLWMEPQRIEEIRKKIPASFFDRRRGSKTKN